MMDEMGFRPPNLFSNWKALAAASSSDNRLEAVTKVLNEGVLGWRIGIASLEVFVFFSKLFSCWGVKQVPSIVIFFFHEFIWLSLDESWWSAEQKIPDWSWLVQFERKIRFHTAERITWFDLQLALMIHVIINRWLGCLKLDDCTLFSKQGVADFPTAILFWTGYGWGIHSIARMIQAVLVESHRLP